MDPDLQEFLVHSVTVEPWVGESGYGTPIYGLPVTVGCWVDETTRMVRATDGQEVVSSATITAPPATLAPAGTRITLPSGRATTVITIAHADSGPLDLPNHTEIVCE